MDAKENWRDGEDTVVVESKSGCSSPSDELEPNLSALDSAKSGPVDDGFEDIESGAEIPQPSLHMPTIPPIHVSKKSIVQDLRIEEVRWFYRLSETDKWVPFRGCDSLAIEVSWRLSENMPLSPEAAKENGRVKCANPAGRAESSDTPSVVLDGFFELDLEQMIVKSIYWDGESYSITRGTWFLVDSAGWVPLNALDAETIEMHHLRNFVGQRIPDKPVFFEKGSKPVLTELKLKDHTIIWNSVIDIYAKWAKSFYRTAEARLFRGYDMLASPDDCPLPAKQLVFVIHGIGQKRAVQAIVKQTAAMAEIAQTLVAREFKHATQRVMFLPIEWRSSLVLDGGVVEQITPAVIESIRGLLNSTAMDILYYTSPLYRSEIVEAAANQMNAMYSLFAKYNPHFEAEGGKISVVAHSLGSVITYDILSSWSPIGLYEAFVNKNFNACLARTESQESTDSAKLVQELDEAKERFLADTHGLSRAFSKQGPKLKFKVANLFNLGSPLAVFLALRGDLGHSIIAPSICERMYNLYHPCDPVAYRIEPLVIEDYTNVKPVQIHYYQEVGKKGAYTSGDLKLYDPRKWKKVRSAVLGPTASAISGGSGSDSECSDFVPSYPESVRLAMEGDPAPSPVPKPRGHSKAPTPGMWARLTGRGGRGTSKSAGSSSAPSTSSTTSVSERTLEQKLDHRIDFTLRQSTLEPSYISAIYSHVGYWSNYDVIMFILMHLLPLKRNCAGADPDPGGEGGPTPPGEDAPASSPEPGLEPSPDSADEGGGAQ